MRHDIQSHDTAQTMGHGPWDHGPWTSQSDAWAMASGAAGRLVGAPPCAQWCARVHPAMAIVLLVERDTGRTGRELRYVRARAHAGHASRKRAEERREKGCRNLCRKREMKANEHSNEVPTLVRNEPLRRPLVSIDVT